MLAAPTLTSVLIAVAVGLAAAFETAAPSKWICMVDERHFGSESDDRIQHDAIRNGVGAIAKRDRIFRGSYFFATVAARRAASATFSAAASTFVEYVA